MNVLGTIIPFFGRRIAPCDEDGIPATTELELEYSMFETGTYVFAWLGMAVFFPFGEVTHRKFDR